MTEQNRSIWIDYDGNVDVVTTEKVWLDTIKNGDRFCFPNDSTIYTSDCDYPDEFNDVSYYEIKFNKTLNKWTNKRHVMSCCNGVVVEKEKRI